MYSEQKQALAETQALKRPAVLAVSGVHNSGKTTLLEKLKKAKTAVSTQEVSSHKRGLER